MTIILVLRLSAKIDLIQIN